MKITFVVYAEYATERVMGLLEACRIDYYTRWDKAQGKGRSTEPHLGRGSHGTLNGVTMIAFEDEAPLEALIAAIGAANAMVNLPDERIRLFEMPLLRMV